MFLPLGEAMFVLPDSVSRPLTSSSFHMFDPLNVALMFTSHHMFYSGDEKIHRALDRVNMEGAGALS